jgi:integrase
VASVNITRRKSKTGTRYVVRYRLGGRAYPIQHGGSFGRERDAKTRRDLIAGELAAGRNPADALRAMADPQRPITLSTWFERFMDSRVDVVEKTRELYGNARDRIIPRLGDRDPHTVTAADIAEVIASNDGLSPGSLRKYRSTWAQVFDFADVTPNPVRSPKVKLPEDASEEIAPPAQADWNLIKTHIAKKLSLIVRYIECEGVRVSEALQLTYGDCDFTNGRVRISRTRTKSAAGQRWLAVPDELLDEIAALVPLEDRHPDRLVFPRLTKAAVRDGLYRACRNAQIAAYSPHDLRHRRVSLWVAQGFDPVAVKTWAGHSRTSMTLDVYSHVIIDPNADEWRSHWASVYAAERAPRVVSVWSEETEKGAGAASLSQWRPSPPEGTSASLDATPESLANPQQCVWI